MSEQSAKPQRLLQRREVELRVGLKRSAIYDRIAKGKFPKPIHDEDTETVWWLESDIDSWIEAKLRHNNRVVGSNGGDTKAA